MMHILLHLKYTDFDIGYDKGYIQFDAHEAAQKAIGHSVLNFCFITLSHNFIMILT